MKLDDCPTALQERIRRQIEADDRAAKLRQADLLQPSSLDVEGHRLADTVAEVQQAGAVITRMAKGATNGTWRLSLHWPQQPEANLTPRI